MKKLLFIFGLLVALNPGNSFAQDKTQATKTYLLLGNIRPTTNNGQTTYPNMTREELLANTTITAMTAMGTCEVVEFTFGMFPKGKEFVGPFTVKGGKLTSEIINLIKNTEASDVRMYIENISLKCDEKETKATPILFRMVTNK